MELVDDSIGVGQVHRFKLDFTEFIKTDVVSHFSVKAGGAQQSVAVSLAYGMDGVVVRHEGAASCALASGHDGTPGESSKQRAGQRMPSSQWRAAAQNTGFVSDLPILSRLRPTAR
jgi:hypothetical protein